MKAEFISQSPAFELRTELPAAELRALAKTEKDDKSDNGIPYSLQRLFALIILLIVSPILLVAALAIRFESRGSVLFSQIRVGENGARFRMYKLRSMYQKDDRRYREPEQSTSNREGICQKFYHDPRVSAVGRLIRKFSIDELPQLLNVVLGDMALIGPRPALPRETDQYNYKTLRRLDCRPGLTGLWQVSGRADLSFEDQIRLDTQYVENRSMFLDISVLARTFGAVIFARGAY